MITTNIILLIEELYVPKLHVLFSGPAVLLFMLALGLVC